MRLRKIGLKTLTTNAAGALFSAFAETFPSCNGLTVAPLFWPDFEPSELAELLDQSDEENTGYLRVDTCSYPDNERVYRVASYTQRREFLARFDRAPVSDRCEIREISIDLGPIGSRAAAMSVLEAYAALTGRAELADTADWALYADLLSELSLEFVRPPTGFVVSRDEREAMAYYRAEDDSYYFEPCPGSEFREDEVAPWWVGGQTPHALAGRAWDVLRGVL